MASLHLDAFCQFWFDNFNSPIPPLPSKPSDLSVTQLELLRMYDGGKLYQNLFAVKPDSGKLPADLENKINVQDDFILQHHLWSDIKTFLIINDNKTQ